VRDRAILDRSFLSQQSTTPGTLTDHDRFSVLLSSQASAVPKPHTAEWPIAPLVFSAVNGYAFFLEWAGRNWCLLKSADGGCRALTQS
jgi:hypothetical protein